MIPMLFKTGSAPSSFSRPVLDREVVAEAHLAQVGVGLVLWLLPVHSVDVRLQRGVGDLLEAEQVVLDEEVVEELVLVAGNL